ncbi:unnamed protein product [Camellia sinensis]
MIFQRRQFFCSAKDVKIKLGYACQQQNKNRLWSMFSYDVTMHCLCTVHTWFIEEEEERQRQRRLTPPACTVDYIRKSRA